MTATEQPLGGRYWTIPADRSLDLIQEAAAGIAEAERQTIPANPQSCITWLGSVAALCAQSGSAQEAKTWLNAMASVLAKYPAGCFTAATVEMAAKADNGFRPTLAKLAEVLDPIAAEVREGPKRLRKIVDAGVSRDTPMAGPRNRRAYRDGPTYTPGTWADCVQRLRDGTACNQDINELRFASLQGSDVSSPDRAMINRALDEIRPATPPCPKEWPPSAR